MQIFLSSFPVIRPALPLHNKCMQLQQMAATVLERLEIVIFKMKQHITICNKNNAFNLTKDETVTTKLMMAELHQPDLLVVTFIC